MVTNVSIRAGYRNNKVKPIRDSIEVVIRDDKSGTNSALLSSNLRIEFDVPDLTRLGFARVRHG